MILFSCWARRNRHFAMAFASAPRCKRYIFWHQGWSHKALMYLIMYLQCKTVFRQVEQMVQHGAMWKEKPLQEGQRLGLSGWSHTWVSPRSPEFTSHSKPVSWVFFSYPSIFFHNWLCGFLFSLNLTKVMDHFCGALLILQFYIEKKLCQLFIFCFV